MSNLIEERADLELEDCQYRAAVSENFANKVGASINFINRNQALQVRAEALGAYHINASDTNIQGIITYHKNFEIVDASIWAGSVVPTTGYMEFDIQWRPRNSGSFVTIFSTKPKFDNTAVANTDCATGQTATGFTAPVFSKTQFDAFDQLIVNYTSTATGNPNSAGLTIWYRPR